MPTEAPIKILLVDDHPVTRGGIRLLLETNPDFQIIAEAGSAEEALNYAQELKIDLALVDVHLEYSTLNGIELTEKLKKEFPHISVLVISMYNNTAYAEQAIEAGARGYISKSTKAEEINRAIQELRSGGTYIDPNLIIAEERPESFLSPCQLEILWYIGDPKLNSSKCIAKILNKPVGTVEKHRSNIREIIKRKRESTELTEGEFMIIAMLYRQRHSKPAIPVKKRQDKLS
jgi:DNA-binding NarL/FixJ family response regulator